MIGMKRRFAEVDSRDTWSSHARTCRVSSIQVNRASHYLFRSHGEAPVELGHIPARLTCQSILLSFLREPKVDTYTTYVEATAQ